MTNDPDGRDTFEEVLRGWETDEQVAAALRSAGRDVATFLRMLPHINDFSKFKSEAEFGQFIQSSLVREGGTNFVRSPKSGAGIHNWLHGAFQDGSKISVGSIRFNLGNIMFWRIHGWIEAKWKQFEASRPRTRQDQRLYDKYMRSNSNYIGSMSAQKQRELEAKAAREAEKITEERERQERELERQSNAEKLALEREQERKQREAEAAAEAEAEKIEQAATQQEEEERRLGTVAANREREEREKEEERRREAEAKAQQNREELRATEEEEERAERDAAERVEESPEDSSNLCPTSWVNVRVQPGRRSRRVFAADPSKEYSVDVSKSTKHWWFVSIPGKQSGYSSKKYWKPCRKTSQPKLCPTTGVNVRRQPGSTRLFVAQAGMQCTEDKSKSRGKWLFLHCPGKASGYSFGTYWKSCSPAARSQSISTGRSILSYSTRRARRERNEAARLERKRKRQQRKLERKQGNRGSFVNRLFRGLLKAFRSPKRVPQSIIDSCTPIIFTDNIPCWRLTTDCTTPQCPQGPRTRQ